HQERGLLRIFLLRLHRLRRPERLGRGPGGTPGVSCAPARRQGSRFPSHGPRSRRGRGRALDFSLKPFRSEAPVTSRGFAPRPVASRFSRWHTACASRYFKERQGADMEKAAEEMEDTLLLDAYSRAVI